MAARRIALGLRPHTGWAAAVAVEERRDGVAIVARRRVALVDEDLPAQIYHSVQDLDPDETQDLIERVRTSANAAAARFVDEFAGHELAGLGVVAWQPNVPDDIDRVLASHQLMHAAEGDLYRSALLAAAAVAGVAAVSFLPTDLSHVVSATLGLGQDVVTEHLAALGRAAGPPWQKDQKEGTLAAWAVLRLTEDGEAAARSARSETTE